MVPATDRHGRHGRSKIGIELTLRRSPLRGGLALRDRIVAALNVARSAIDMQADGIIRRIGLRPRGCRHANRCNRKHRPSQNTHRSFAFGSAAAWSGAHRWSRIWSGCWTRVKRHRQIKQLPSAGSEASPSSHTAHNCGAGNQEAHRSPPSRTRRRIEFVCCIVAGRRQRPLFAQRSSCFGSGVASCDCI